MSELVARVAGVRYHSLARALNGALGRLRVLPPNLVLKNLAPRPPRQPEQDLRAGPGWDLRAVPAKLQTAGLKETEKRLGALAALPLWFRGRRKACGPIVGRSRRPSGALRGRRCGSNTLDTTVVLVAEDGDVVEVLIVVLLLLRALLREGALEVE